LLQRVVESLGLAHFGLYKSKMSVLFEMHCRRLQILIFVCCLLFVLVNGFQKPVLGLKPLSKRSTMRPVQVKTCMCKKMNGKQLFIFALVFFQFASNFGLYLGCMCKKMNGRQLFIFALVFFQFASNFGLYLGLCLGVKELDAHVKKLDQSAISLKQEKSNSFNKDKNFLLFLE